MKEIIFGPYKFLHYSYFFYKMPLENYHFIISFIIIFVKKVYLKTSLFRKMEEIISIHIG